MVPLSVFSINILSENVLLLVSVLVFIAIILTQIGTKFGVPSLLLFLVIGMIAGTDGIGIHFEDYHLGESIGHFAMTIILFTGGLQTSLQESKPVMKQGALLSTLGVFITALLTGGFIYFATRNMVGEIGGTFLGCLLLASVMGSTDSASVFSILRGKKLHLRERIGTMLELESSSNDPMAYALTIIIVQILTTPSGLAAKQHGMILTGVGILILQIIVGTIVGIAVGYGAKYLLEKVKLSGNSLNSILILSIGFFSNGIATVLYGNGLLALYLTAIIINNKANIPYKRDVLKFFDGMTWLMQLLMFLMLGLLARPSQMLHSLVPALLIGLFLLIVARPASVFICLAPFKELSTKAKVLISWVGLKGAGPILFALYPVIAGLEGSDDIFNIVFVITLLSLVTQGMTLSRVAKKLDLSFDEDPEIETFGLEIPDEMGILRDHTVTDADLAGGSTLRDLNLPHGIRVMMVRRGEHFLVPHGSMRLLPEDHLVIVMGESDDDLEE